MDGQRGKSEKAENPLVEWERGESGESGESGERQGHS